MEKIDINKEGNERPVICANTSKTIYYFIMERLNELIENQNLLDKLAIRVARLEVYYKAHRKEHEKK